MPLLHINVIVHDSSQMRISLLLCPYLVFGYSFILIEWIADAKKKNPSKVDNIDVELSYHDIFK